MIHYKYWLAINRIPGADSKVIREIHDKISPLSVSIADIFSCSLSEIKNEFSFSEEVLSLIEKAMPLVESVEDEYLSLVEAGIRITLPFEKEYPAKILSALGAAAPGVLYSIGNISLASSSNAAIISHSNTSDKGKAIALQTAVQLARRGIPLSGGLSKGAVVSAQIASLENGGSTTAVIPCGILTFDMPKAMTALFDPERCLILSPFSPDDGYSLQNAASRNTILCAIADAVFIVESTSGGGTIEAAETAKKMNRPLYTAQYAEYPPEAAGNPSLISGYGAIPVRGRKEGADIIPNIEHMISAVE